MIDVYELRELAREDLRRYRDARRDIDHMKDIIARQQAKAERVTRPLDPEWVPVQREDPGPEELLCLIADMQQECRDKQVAAEKICLEIERRICEWTSGIEQRILRKHYLFACRLKDLTDENYSLAQIKRLHRKALEHYGEKMTPNDPLGCDTIVL